MPFNRHFNPKRFTVMRAFILRIGSAGNRTYYPGVANAMLYQLSYNGLPTPTHTGTHIASYLCGLQDKVVNDDLLFVRKA
jgi:hypothetical protein